MSCTDESCEGRKRRRAFETQCNDVLCTRVFPFNATIDCDCWGSCSKATPKLVSFRLSLLGWMEMQTGECSAAGPCKLDGAGDTTTQNLHWISAFCGWTCRPAKRHHHTSHTTPLLCDLSHAFLSLSMHLVTCFIVYALLGSPHKLRENTSWSTCHESLSVV